ncbi:MAG: type II secretion system F family protein [Chloroflexi bacterium]|nr:type II secretion system F family protein [Chloroflexota bacterium]
MNLLLIGGGALILLLLIIGIVITMTGERSLVEERLTEYVGEEFYQDAAGDEKTSPVSDWVNVRVEGTEWGGGVARNLAQADLKLKPGEYLALFVIAIIGVGFVAWFFGGRSIVSAIIGAIVGFFLPRFYVNRQKRKRLTTFGDQLPDMLGLMVNGLRAGYSTAQAMEAVSKEMPSPLSDEFKRVVQEMQLGLPMEKAMDNILRRIPSDDLDLIITAINVQREVGGNLAEILDTIAHTIRERVRIKGEIRVLTAQVMYSGRFLALLPFILSSIIWFGNKEYVMSVFQPDVIMCGFAIFGSALILVGLGYFVMTRIADIEV